MVYKEIKSITEWFSIILRFQDRLYNVIVHTLGKKEGNVFLDNVDETNNKKILQILFRCYLRLEDPTELYSEEILLDTLIKSGFLLHT